MHPAIPALASAPGGQPIPTLSMERLSHCTRHSFPGMEILPLELFARVAEHIRQAHRYDCYTLMLVTAGNGSHYIDFQEYTIEPGSQFFILPGQVHTWKALEQVRGFILFFTHEFATLHGPANLLQDFPFFDLSHPVTRIALPPAAASPVVQDYERLFHECSHPAPYQAQAVNAVLSLLLADLARAYAATASAQEDAPVQGAQALIRQYEHLVSQHFIQLRSVDAYAEMLCVSPGHLRTLCRRHTGKSAGHLIRERVVLEAKRLLIHSALGIAAIAYQLQFEDNAYFSRFFKKYEGVTPEAFRQQHRPG